MTFYETKQNINSSFRFGDVLKGVILSSPKLSPPHNSTKDFTLKITQPSFAVILTPCCSIEDNSVLMAPLEKIQPKWVTNPAFAKNFTIINEPMLEYDALTPEEQNKLATAEANKLKQKKSYIYLYLFVYKPSKKLQKYQFKHRKIEYSLGYYMINFKKMQKIDSNLFNRTTQDAHIIKTLQLSKETRKLLRKKLVYYYGREPDEDKTIQPENNIKNLTPEKTRSVSQG